MRSMGACGVIASVAVMAGCGDAFASADAVLKRRRRRWRGCSMPRWSNGVATAGTSASTLARDVVFVNDAGFVWNPLFGYRNGNDVTLWEFRYFQPLENPYVTPYWDLLTMMDPAQWNRIRFGVRHSFALTVTITLTPFVEAVWGDRSRFKSRYGESPDDTFLGGVICTLTPDVQLDWRFAESWRAYAKFREFVTVDSLARRLVSEMDDYWEVNDLPIGTDGLAYDF